MSQVGIAMIGTGMWGRRLAMAIQRTPSLRLVTCFSRDAAKRGSFGREFGCETSESFESAISHPEVEGVLLVTPNHVHAEQTAACAAVRRHVLVEKPIADDVDDGLAMQAACEQEGVALLVGHAFRRLGAARKVKKLLDEGVLGQVVLAEANFSLPGTLTPEKWRYYRETCPGGPLMQLGIHQVDTLLYWLGDAQRVMGSLARLATTAEIDDLGTVTIKFASGARGIVSSSYVSPKTFYLRLYGTEANLIYETDMSVWPQAEKMDGATTLALQTKSGSKHVDFVAQDMVVAELEEFGRCVRGEMQPETDAAVGLAALRVVRGAIAAHECGGSVEV